MQFREACEFIAAKLTKELARNLSYHNMDHILDVYHAAERIAQQEHIPEYEIRLLLTAAMYHDSGFLLARAGHEELSCDFVKEYLPQFGYSAEDIGVICGMIRATKIPQSPKNKLEEVLCDADLDYLGRSDFFTIGERFFLELCAAGEIQSERDWNLLQISFLENHRYFTPTSITSRKQIKEDNLRTVKLKTQAL